MIIFRYSFIIPDVFRILPLIEMITITNEFFTIFLLPSDYLFQFLSSLPFFFPSSFYFLSLMFCSIVCILSNSLHSCFLHTILFHYILLHFITFLTPYYSLTLYFRRFIQNWSLSKSDRDWIKKHCPLQLDNFMRKKNIWEKK